MGIALRYIDDRIDQRLNLNQANDELTFAILHNLIVICLLLCAGQPAQQIVQCLIVDFKVRYPHCNRRLTAARSDLFEDRFDSTGNDPSVFVILSGTSLGTINK